MVDILRPLVNSCPAELGPVPRRPRRDSLENKRLEGALVFKTSEPALRFYATNRIDALQDRPADGSHRRRLLPPMRELIEAIIAREGAFIVPKSVGWFTCMLEP